MSRVWQRIRHRLEYGLVLGARWLDRLLGPRRADALASALGRFVYRRLRIRADVVEDQLRRAYPDRDDAWVRATARASYEHLAREAMTLIRLSRLGPEAVIAATDVAGDFDRLRAAIDRGEGAVLVSGHLGNWEICGAAIAVRDVPMDAVARRQANPLVDALVNRARERLGMTVVRMGEATKRSLRSLKDGRAVGLVADQDARHRGVFVPFFGRPASTFRGPAVLALRTGAPVFVTAATREPDGRYRVRVRAVPASMADGPDPEQALTAALAAELESMIRDAPAQYLWHHRRWKTRPPGGGGTGPGNGDRSGSV